MRNSFKAYVNDIRFNNPMPPMKTREYVYYISGVMVVSYVAGRFDGWRFAKRDILSK